MGEFFPAFISNTESVFMVLVDGPKFPTISSPFAVIPASPSGLPISDISDQRSFDLASTKSEKTCLLNYCGTYICFILFCLE